MKVLLSLFALLLSISAQAKTANPHCSVSGVAHVTLNGFSNFPNFNAKKDLCADAKDLKAYPNLEQMIDHANADIRTICTKLDLSFTELFPQGITLAIEADPVAYVDEFADPQNLTIHLEQFADWSGNSFDASIFAHEFGHLIAYTIPTDRALYDLNSLPVLSEGFSDLVAKVVTGATATQSQDYPAPFFQVTNRDLEGHFSYEDHLGFYTATDFFKSFLNLCQTLRGLSSDVQKACANLQADFQAPYLQSKLKGEDLPFSTDACFTSNTCDLHQTSLPWTSSIVQLGADPALQFLKLLTGKNSALPLSHFTCNYDSDLGRKNAVTIQAHTWEGLISAFEQNLDAPALAKWNALSASSHLDLSKDFGLKWQREYVLPYQALAAIMNLYGASGDFYNSSNPCKDWMNADSAPESCKMVCQ